MTNHNYSPLPNENHRASYSKNYRFIKNAYDPVSKGSTFSFTKDMLLNWYYYMGIKYSIYILVTRDLDPSFFLGESRSVGFLSTQKCNKISNVKAENLTTILLMMGFRNNGDKLSKLWVRKRILFFFARS